MKLCIYAAHIEHSLELCVCECVYASPSKPQHNDA